MADAAEEEPQDNGFGLQRVVMIFLITQSMTRLLFGAPQTAPGALSIQHLSELRSDIEALRREHREKGELIARQRERLLRWSAECAAIEAAHQAQLALPANDAPAAQTDGWSCSQTR